MGVKIKVIRIFNTYGPMMDPNDGRVVSNFICQALRGEDLTIYGDGSQTRSFCYVDDLIEVIIKMMASTNNTLFSCQTFFILPALHLLFPVLFPVHV